MHIDKKKVIAIVSILVLLTAFIILTRPKNCHTDDACFSVAASKCNLAKVITLSNDNKYQYEVLGKKGANCIIKATLLNLSESQSLDLRNALNGRDMKCAISLELLKTKHIKDIENLNKYCTGDLKEAILEITTEKLQDIIIENMGEIAIDLKGINTVTK